MRARPVNENISFKRGLDPKKSLDIGFDKALVLDQNHGDFKVWNYGDLTFVLDQDSSPPWDWQLYHLYQEGTEEEHIATISQHYSDYQIMEMARDLIKKYLGKNESVNFERGMDPKGSMKIGKAGKVNYFRDNLNGIPYKEYIEKEGAWPWDEGREILTEAAKMLDVNEEDVMIAVEYENEPLTTARIEEYIEDHEWNYENDQDVGSFSLIKTTTGEIYVFEVDTQEDPYMILGSRF